MRETFRPAAALALALLAWTAGCGRLQGAATGRDGWLAYRVGGLALELPQGWSVRGDPRQLSAESPDGKARVKAEQVERAFASGEECLSQAEQSLARGAAELERSRRHPTRLGGRPALVQEADRGGWHGWAWAACDGRLQYRLFFVGLSPMTPDAFAAQRGIEGAARFDGRP